MAIKKQTGLTFAVLSQAIVNGKSVRRRARTNYWWMDRGNPECNFPAGIYSRTPEGNAIPVYDFSDYDILANDWEIV